MFTYAFEKLEVYKSVCKFTDEIYKLTKDFPSHERFALTSQIRRSASSVGANLAEGTTRISMKEQARFSEISFSSLAETFHHLLQAERLDYLKQEQLNNLRPLVFEISNKINALRKSQISRHNSKIKTDPHLREPEVLYETLKSSLLENDLKD